MHIGGLVAEVHLGVFAFGGVLDELALDAFEFALVGGVVRVAVRQVYLHCTSYYSNQYAQKQQINSSIKSIENISKEIIRLTFSGLHSMI